MATTDNESCNNQGRRGSLMLEIGNERVFDPCYHVNSLDLVWPRLSYRMQAKKQVIEHSRLGYVRCE